MFYSRCFLKKVAAGKDHDLKGLFCKIDPDSRLIYSTLICSFREKSNFTKKVVKIHIHPQYVSEYDDKKISGIARSVTDLSLIEVEPFTLSEELNILPGCLFESNLRSFGDRLLAAGLFCFQILGFINRFALLTSSRPPGYGRTQPLGKKWPFPIGRSQVIREGWDDVKWNETYPDETKLRITKYSQSDCEVGFFEFSSRISRSSHNIIRFS